MCCTLGVLYSHVLYTEMTLNTFHNTGISAKNVTLGVPRLNEILNVSKKVRTPSLTIYLREECCHDEQEANDLQVKLEYTTRGDVTLKTEIHYDPDPRATVMQKTVREVFDALKVKDPVFEVALRLEEMALNDPYFIEKKLFPNVDFYSGVIRSAIGFPTTMFTALFALARTVGWVAQWNEMISDPGQKIGRPRQLYTGPAQRDYVSIDKR